MKCPGQDTRYWKPGDIFETSCPHCGRPVEFFKDESARRCRACGKMAVNPRMDFGCAAYCAHAADCLGEIGPELAAKRDDLLKDRVAVEVKRRLGRDFRSISHAAKVARYAEEIARKEKTGPAAVLCAAFLHVFGELRQARGPCAARREREEREVLERLGASPELTAKVLHIVDDFAAAGPLFGKPQADPVDARLFAEAHRLAAAEERNGEEAGGKEDKKS